MRVVRRSVFVASAAVLALTSGLIASPAGAAYGSPYELNAQSTDYYTEYSVPINTEIPLQEVNSHGDKCNFTFEYGNYGVAFAKIRLDSGYCDTGLKETGVRVTNGSLQSSAYIRATSFHQWYQETISGSVLEGTVDITMQDPAGQTKYYGASVIDFTWASS